MGKDTSLATAEQIEIGVLGPQCSYTDQACAQFIPDTKRIQYPSITKVIESVCSRKIEYGLIPLENLLNGLVGETLDLLRIHSHDLEIINSTQLEINHFIGVAGSNKSELSDILSIYSHPQALEQSRDFIGEHCPKATLIDCTSTSEATTRLSMNDMTIAAIASKSALELQNARILSQTTTTHNATRFILIKRTGAKDLDVPNSPHTSEDITSIMIHPGSDREGLLLEILSIISGKFGANLSAIHSRPDGLGGFVFYLELCLRDRGSELEQLISALKQYCSRETGGRAHISILGTYHRAPFFTPHIKSIGIIGGNGAMGKWFNHFFTNLGLKVVSVDIGSDARTLEELRTISVVIFSVPMHLMESVVKQYKSFISIDSLVVENCSVKERSLECLVENFPERQEILGFHTMFGPGIESIKKENVIITKTASSNTLSDEFEKIFYKAGALTHHGSVEEHDNCVSILQALMQYSSLVLANTLLSKSDDLEKLKPYLTPNSKALIANIERLLLQSADLIYDIQDQNESSRTLRNEFSESSLTLEKLLSSENDFKVLHKKLQDILGPILSNLK